MDNPAEKLKQRLAEFQSRPSLVIVRIEMTSRDAVQVFGMAPPGASSVHRHLSGVLVEEYATDIEPTIVWTQDGSTHYRSLITTEAPTVDEDEPDEDEFSLDFHVPGLFRFTLGPA